MKKANLIWMAIFLFAIFSACSKTETDVNTSKTLPVKVVVDIPSAISSSGTLKNLVVDNDTARGSEIYRNLRLFIGVGEGSAEVVQNIFNALKQYGINKPMDFTYTSDDDKHTKKCVVVANASYEGKSYELKLTISDENNKALQIYWNSNPAEGVAILNPHWINRNDILTSAMYKIEFGRNISSTYDSQMTVSITGLTPIGVYGIDKLKMFVGRKGNTVEVFGNSNHPNGILFDLNNKDGFSYAFAIRADSVANIAISKLALPGTSLASTDKIFENYSLYKIFSDELHNIWDPKATTDVEKAYVNGVISAYLVHAQIPAYFNKNGYIGCGTTLPTGFSVDFANMVNLLPYAPKTVKDLTISFGE